MAILSQGTPGVDAIGPSVLDGAPGETMELDDLGAGAH